MCITCCDQVNYGLCGLLCSTLLLSDVCVCVQQAGTALECCYWPPVNDDDHLANLLATIVNNCYVSDTRNTLL